MEGAKAKTQLFKNIKNSAKKFSIAQQYKIYYQKNTIFLKIFYGHIV